MTTFARGEAGWCVFNSSPIEIVVHLQLDSRQQDCAGLCEAFFFFSFPAILNCWLQAQRPTKQQPRYVGVRSPKIVYLCPCAVRRLGATARIDVCIGAAAQPYRRAVVVRVASAARAHTFSRSTPARRRQRVVMLRGASSPARGLARAAWCILYPTRFRSLLLAIATL